jgi:hypothetical protein
MFCGSSRCFALLCGALRRVAVRYVLLHGCCTSIISVYTINCPLHVATYSGHLCWRGPSARARAKSRRSCGTRARDQHFKKRHGSGEAQARGAYAREHIGRVLQPRVRRATLEGPDAAPATRRPRGTRRRPRHRAPRARRDHEREARRTHRRHICALHVSARPG